MEFSESTWEAALSAPDAPTEAPVAEAPESTEMPESPDAPVETTEVSEEPVETELPVAASPEAPVENAEKLPEDVTVTERNGKKLWNFPEQKGRELIAARDLTRHAQDIFGEDVTPESLADRQASHDWLQTQHLDLISNNPKDQINAFANMFDDIDKAIEAGEISHDPRATVGAAFARTLAHKAPEAYEAMSNGIIQDKIQDLYREAHKAGNTQLLRSVQNLDHHFRGKFLKDDEVAASIPTEIDQRTRDLEAREARLNGLDRQQSEREWKSWQNSAVTSSRDAVTQAVTDAIPQNIKDAYKGSPESLARVEKLLRIEIEESIKSDPKWAQTRKNLIRQAALGSEAVRVNVLAELAKRYTTRARQVIGTKAADILNAEAKAAKVATTATQQRHETGKTRKAVPGSSVPAPRNLPDPAANGFNRSTWSAFLSEG